MSIKALNFAAEAHIGQVRKYSNVPYIIHPVRVMMLCQQYSIGEACRTDIDCVALLHDVVEDTPITLSQIENVFGIWIAHCVDQLTNRSKLREFSHLSRPRRKEIDREHIAKASPMVKCIKMLDRMDNLRDISSGPRDFRKLYLQESRLLLDVCRTEDYHNVQIAGDLEQLIETMHA